MEVGGGIKGLGLDGKEEDERGCALLLLSLLP